MAKRKPRRRLTPEQAGALLEQMERDDPLTYYNLEPRDGYLDPDSQEVYRLGPGPTQLACYQSTAHYRLLEAGNQLGKTAHCLVECAAFARGKHATRPWYGPVNLLVIVPSRSQAATVWHRRLCIQSRIKGPAYDKPLIPEHEIQHIAWNYSGAGRVPGLMTLKNGSTIMFGWAGSDGQWERIQGNEFDAIFRDEATGNQRLGSELMMRLTTIQSDAKKPGGGFMLWSATPTLINREFDEYKRRCVQGVPGHAHFRIKPDENPAQSQAVRDSLRLVLSEHEQKVRLDGTDDYRGQFLIYAPFWDDRRHVLAQDYEPGPTDNLWISFDPSFGSMASEVGILCAAISRDAPFQIKVVRFCHYRHGTLRDHVEQMRLWLQGRWCEGIVCDPAILRTESTGKSVYTQLEELVYEEDLIRTHRGLILGRNRKEDTIPMVQSYLAQDLITVSPNGEGCGEFRYGMLDYQTKEEGKYSGPKGAVDKETEAVDTIRYLISTEPHWVDRGMNLPRGRRHPLQVVDPSITPIDLAEMPEDERLHRERLRMSAEIVERYGRQGSGGGILPARRIG